MRGEASRPFPGPAPIVSFSDWLSISYGFDRSLRIALKIRKPQQQDNSRISESPKVLKLRPSSGPFFICSDS